MVYTLPVTPVLNSKIRADEFKNIQIAITLIRSGQTEKARSVLVALCRRNNDCEAGWLWLAQAAQTSKQRSACLKQVLRINPDNHHARKWLEQAQPEAPPAQESPAFVSTEPDSAPPQLEVRTEPELEPVTPVIEAPVVLDSGHETEVTQPEPPPAQDAPVSVESEPEPAIAPPPVIEVTNPLPTAGLVLAKPLQLNPPAPVASDPWLSAIELIDYDRQEPLPPPAVPATPSASLVETPARHLTFGLCAGM